MGKRDVFRTVDERFRQTHLSRVRAHRKLVGERLGMWVQLVVCPLSRFRICIIDVGFSPERIRQYHGTIPNMREEAGIMWRH